MMGDLPSYLKFTISNLTAKDLRDTGSKKDPQDPSITFKISKFLFKTKRHRDAGKNASFEEIFTFNLDPTQITSTLLEVEVRNISDPNNPLWNKDILIGSGNVTLFDLLNELKDGKKAMAVNLYFTEKNLISAGRVEFQLHLESEELAEKMVRGHVSSAVECEKFDDKTRSDTKEISGNVALLDRCQAPLKVTIFSLKAQELRDSGGVDPQDPCVTFKLGSNFYRTKRQKDAGTSASFPERFTFEIDPAQINTANFLEVEVRNISDSNAFSWFGEKNILIGSGKVTIFDLLNEAEDKKKAIVVNLNFTDNTSKAKGGVPHSDIPAGRVEFQLHISAPITESSSSPTSSSIDTILRAYKLNISHVSVQNLPAANGDSKTSDPYVKVSLRNMDETVVIDVGMTPYIKNSKGNTAWKDMFMTYTIDHYSHLLLEIFDWNWTISQGQFNKHEYMGFVTVELSQYLTESPTPAAFSINDQIQNQNRFKGSASLSFGLEVEPVDPSVAFRKSTSSAFDKALIAVADERLINRLYDAHYVDLRKSRDEIESLSANTTIDNKKVILLESKKGSANKWTEAEDKLLHKLNNSPQIDYCDLEELEKHLIHADVYMLNSFFKEHGMRILLSILYRLSEHPDKLGELDVGIMMQTLRCVKAVMGDTTTVGMEGLFADQNQNLTTCIRNCLIFEYKPLALLVMDMLRLCSVYDAKSIKQTISSVLYRSAPTDPAPCFVKLCDALKYGDIEVKTAVLELVNTMVYQAVHFKEMKMHNELRNELQKHNFETLVKKAMYTINKESDTLDSMLLINDSSALDTLSICVGHAKRDPRKSQVSFYLEPALRTEESARLPVKSTRSSTSRRSIFSFDSKRSLKSESEHGGIDNLEEQVPESTDPVEEIMSGTLLVQNKFNSSKLKPRHYVLNSAGFHAYHGPSKNNSLKASYLIRDIDKVKLSTTINAFSNEIRPLFSMLIKGTEFAFVCENKDDRDLWMNNLKESIQQHLTKKAKSKSNFQIYGEYLTLNKVRIFITEFKNQYSIYERMMFGNRENIIRKSGVDWQSIHDVSKFLIAEAIASGKSENLLRIFQQLLLIPPESEGLWATIPTALQKLLQICKSNTIPSGDILDEDSRAVNAALNDVNIKEQLLKKAEEGGEPYAELHDLALFAVRAEKNNEILSGRIKELEKEIRKLEEVQSIAEENSFLRPHVEEETPAEDSAELQKYSKFKMMKKLKQPDQQIRQNMVKEKIFSDEEIDAFLAGKILSTKKNADMDPAEEERQERLNRFEKGLNEARLLPRAAADNLLSIFQDRIHSYEKTFKISKKDINAVRKHMQRDHCFKEEENHLCKLLQKSSQTSDKNTGEPSIKFISDHGIPDGMEAKPIIKPKRRLQTFFWTKIPSSEVSGTMWDRLQEYDIIGAEGLEDQICEWYSMSPPATTAAAATHSAASKSPSSNESLEHLPQTLISLLPSEKNRTVMIVLKKLKLTPIELMNLVISLDPAVLNESITDSLLGILPVSEELEKAKDYPDPNVLDLAGQFMWHFRQIPDVGKRLKFHSTCFTWFSVASDLNEEVTVLNTVCESMNASRDKVQQLFSIILGIGNYINGGTNHGKAYGFAIKTLQKLSEYKTKKSILYGNTERGSLVDFIVEHMASINHVELLDLSEELCSLSKAATISLVETREVLSKLESDIQQASVEMVKIDGSQQKQESRDDPLTQALYLYQRLDRFVQDSKSMMADLKAAAAETEDNVAKLATYYGVTESSSANAVEDENSDRKEPHQKLFGFVSDFLHAMKTTSVKAEKYRASERMKERRESDRKNRLMAKQKKLSSTASHPPQNDEQANPSQVEMSSESDAVAEGTTSSEELLLPLSIVSSSDSSAGGGDTDDEDESPGIQTSMRSPRGEAPILTGDIFDGLNEIVDLNTFADAVGDSYQRMLEEADAEEDSV